MVRDFVRLLRLVGPLRGWMLAAALLGLATVGAGVGLMATSAYLISAAALHPSIAALEVAIVGVRFFGIARGLFRYGERYASHYVSFRILTRLRVWFYRAVEPLAPARLQDYRTGDLLARVIGDIQTLQDFYVRVLAPPLVVAGAAAGLWLLLGAFDPAFAAIWLAFALIAGVALPWITHAWSAQLGREVVAVRATLNAQVLDGIQGVADLVAFGAEAEHLASVAALDTRLVGLQRRQAAIAGLQTALGGGLQNLALWTMLVVAVPLVRAGRLDGVYLACVGLAAVAGFEAVLPLGAAAQALAAGLAAARRLFALVDAPPAVTDPPDPAPLPVTTDLIVDHLLYTYPMSQQPALDDVSLTLPAGHTLAVVGPSGAGKSTLAALLLRFREPGGGTITLGGRPLGDYAQADVHRLIAVVSQQTHLFNTTVRENLRLARPDATEAELAAALEAAQLTGWLAGLPRGWDTPVGEQGVLLSGGERQRLALARAFLQDAPILLLDEPTAHVDAGTEAALWAVIRRLARGRTTLIITHRLAGAAWADEIAVLDAGRLGEQGPPATLLAGGGLYRRLWDLQAGRLPAEWTGGPAPTPSLEAGAPA